MEYIMWTPNDAEKKHLELVIAMSTDCLMGNGTVDVITYVRNLRMIADLMVPKQPPGE